MSSKFVNISVDDTFFDLFLLLLGPLLFFFCPYLHLPPFFPLGKIIDWDLLWLVTMEICARARIDYGMNIEVYFFHWSKKLSDGYFKTRRCILHLPLLLLNLIKGLRWWQNTHANKVGTASISLKRRLCLLILEIPLTAKVIQGLWRSVRIEINRRLSNVYDIFSYCL